LTEEFNPENLQSQYIPTPSSDKNKNEITIKKSTYNKLLTALVLTIAVAAFFSGYGLATMDNSSLTDEAIAKLLLDAEQRALPTQQPVPVETPIIMVSLDDDPVKGNADAPVTIIEFSDFQCPFCLRFFTQTLPLIEKNYIDSGKVKLVYRDLPLDSLHQNARGASIAAECADEQGKFWQYHDILFVKQTQWQGLASVDFDNTLKDYAGQLGLQVSSFESCMKSPDIFKEVNDDLIQARTYGLTATPSFFIGNEKDGFVKISGAQPYSVFQTVIEDQLN